MHRVQRSEPFRREHRFTTAPAAVADESDRFPDILPELNQIMFIGLLQKIETLLDIDGPGDVMLDQGLGRAVEGHADVEWGIAGLSQMLHLVTAVADAHRSESGAADDLTCPFILQHMQGDLR